MKLVLPDSADPEVSVLMVTYGAWPLTERAVRALVANTNAPFELIVVDNASTDETTARLAELTATRLIRNDVNRGFGPANNQAAAEARSECLVLLNTDAFVHPGWLEPMLETLRQPGVGAVLPRYLHLDGSLQEAGGLLARDGSVRAYGDGDDPNALRYRFRRVVDYGAAACMLIGRQTLVGLGGFDDRYAPAYYEDADLCLRLAQTGVKVVYEPRATVTHVRYGSGTLDGAKQLSERNRKLFVDRWADALAGRPWTLAAATEQTEVAARDASAAPRILVCARPDQPGTPEFVVGLRGAWRGDPVTWPNGPLVTWATGPLAGLDPSPWLELGVELAADADPGWLAGRLFHYDLALLADAPDAALVAALERTQPQATRLPLPELADGPEHAIAQIAPACAAAGIEPPRS